MRAGMPAPPITRSSPRRSRANAGCTATSTKRLPSTDRARGCRSSRTGRGCVRLRLAFGVHDERRRLVFDQILELPAELFERKASRRGELGQLVRILEIIAAQADHVTSGDGVARGMGVHQPQTGAAA